MSCRIFVLSVVLVVSVSSERRRTRTSGDPSGFFCVLVCVLKSKTNGIIVNLTT